MNNTNNKIKNYLAGLGLDAELYDGYFKTNTKYVAKISHTIIYISLDFTAYKAFSLKEF